MASLAICMELDSRSNQTRPNNLDLNVIFQNFAWVFHGSSAVVSRHPCTVPKCHAHNMDLYFVASLIRHTPPSYKMAPMIPQVPVRWQCVPTTREPAI